MDPFVKLTGVVAPLDRVNIDTDQIIPAVFLKRIERSGFEDCLFFSWALQRGWQPQERLCVESTFLPERQRNSCRSQFRVRLIPGTRPLGFA